MGWRKHKLESRLPGEIINNLRYGDDTTLMAECEEELKSLLMKVKEDSDQIDCRKTNLPHSRTSAKSPQSLEGPLLRLRDGTV